MGWVVSSWRTERLATLLDARARDAAREIVLAAERDARRLERVSAREAADAAAYLEILERLGEETRAAVRVQRGELRGGGDEAPVAAPADAPADDIAPPADAPTDDVAPPADAPTDDIVPPGDEVAAEEIRVARAPRTGRASMRDSPLGELFRATAGR